MDFWSRLLGGVAPAKKKPAAARPLNDSTSRLQRFKKVWNTVRQICDKPRGKDPVAEQNDLDQLRISLDRIAQLLRDETRAPVPHLCLQFASGNQIYTTVSRAAAISHCEPVVAATVSVYSALIDSEEEDFLTSSPFAKSLMRMVKSVVDNGNVRIGIETETAILELLFTITAKIRLQPEILPYWFASTAKPEIEDVFVKEKQRFVGLTAKEDFPLCYLLIDRVHHEGRIGDFARTGLLYIFEATGRSSSLEAWVISSDLATLMASGLGALYSQLSRELSILHPDATLPAVLAMSDYSTQHPQSTATSVFSPRHVAHMSTFLSYLAFWQDVLDHCRSDEVKHTLLDHFQILFLQQLLYPSILQSSDTDAGSSVAVLTYMTIILESLEYPALLQMVLRYLLAIPAEKPSPKSNTPEMGGLDGRPEEKSPQIAERRQSLSLTTAAKDPEDSVAPELFSLTDLVLNSATSNNDQTVFAALRLTSVLLVRQKKHALGSFVKVERAVHGSSMLSRTVGALEEELELYSFLLEELGVVTRLDDTYTSLCHDIHLAIESQAPFRSPLGTNTTTSIFVETESPIANQYLLQQGDPLMRSLNALLRTFWSNSVDINLALTQAIISMAVCIELRLDPWLAASPESYHFSGTETYEQLDPMAITPERRPWQSFLADDEIAAFANVQSAKRRPDWTRGDTTTPLIWQTLRQLVRELDIVRDNVDNLEQLTAGRKNMLQGTGLPDAPLKPSHKADHVQSSGQNPSPSLKVPGVSSSQQANVTRPAIASLGHSRSSSASSLARGRTKANNISTSLDVPSTPSQPSPRHSATTSPVRSSTPFGMQVAGVRPSDIASELLRPGQARASSPAVAGGTPGIRNIFMPPPPETPSTTDVLMQKIAFPELMSAAAVSSGEEILDSKPQQRRTVSLNHVLTNVVVLQEFVMELVAVLQVRAAVLAEKEVRLV
ncbi:hypothetical protein K431DRAFT_282653 [Polychaeton citri CBS 116435]|uniref:Retinoic acid induced 16-like protein-domain-containing protein n=1 Tax=Polychaeton citri CBS 116435 TaxID=1314669 RepID=A0A9P4URI9_9PEZI|nr:hypothetical protein K431DRAFT_282653 [Polychaeton citri CBS 116435]